MIPNQSPGSGPNGNKGTALRANDRCLRTVSARPERRAAGDTEQCLSRETYMIFRRPLRSSYASRPLGSAGIHTRSQKSPIATHRKSCRLTYALAFNSAFRKPAVRLFVLSATSSGVPVATISPP